MGGAARGGAARTRPLRPDRPRTGGRRLTRAPVPPVRVRRLEAADAQAFRDLRLEALRTHPDAFSQDYAVEAAEPLEAFARRLAEGAVFGAFAGERLVGMLGVSTSPGTKVAHKGYVWGVYVRAGARGAGVGDALLGAAVAGSAGRLALLQLGVSVDNPGARALYERHGFVAYGLERRAYRLGDRYEDEVLMARDLDG